MRAAPAVFFLAAALAAQVLGPQPHQFPTDTFVRRNPLIVAADEAYSRREEGRVGHVGSPRAIGQAILGYETAAQAPDNLEARWKLARALYFKGAFTGLDRQGRRAVFEKARRVAEEAIAILARRVESGRGESLSKVTPAQKAAALAGEPEAAPVFFWAAVAWGQWALSVGKIEAVTAGAASRIRDGATTVIALDPRYEEAGGYRVLGRLHDRAPRIPFLTGWVSHAEAVRNLRLAVSAAPRSFANRQFLAEALGHGGGEERAEAIQIEERLVADAASPGHLVEDLAMQQRAKRCLERWRGRSGIENR